MNSPPQDSDSPPPPRRRVAWVPWGIAVCAAFGLLQFWLFSRTELRTAQDGEKLARLQTRGLQNQLTAERLISGRQITDLQRQLQDKDIATQMEITSLVSTPGNPPLACGIVAWDPATGRAIVTVGHLPAIASSQNYRFWVYNSHRTNPIDAGILLPAADGNARLIVTSDGLITHAAGFAVSLEQKGAAPRTPSRIVLGSK